MQYNRQLTISAAGSRKAAHWPQQVIWWSELVERLRTAVRGAETLAEYLAMSAAQQGDLKDVGGFVGGTFTNNRRNVHTRATVDILTLDLDNIPAGGTADVLRRIEGLGCAYAVYSTRKHEEARPRLRVLIPLNRTGTGEENEPLARKLAEIIGIELCDPTTFDNNRLMYWPSCCADSQYVFHYGDKPFVDADGLLAMYADWRNVAEWPQVPGAAQQRVRLAARQGDPEAKAGVVGAFCRLYNVSAALETFLPGLYAETDDPARLTYVGGSTTGGAILYDEGKFLYSHHATDPCSGRLVNAFDLVRLHKFADQDDEALPGTPTNRLPSFAAMVAFALQDAGVAAAMTEERYAKAVDSFGAPVAVEPGADAGSPQGQDLSWIKKLELSPTTGRPAKTAANVLIVLQHDEALRGRIYRDSFAERVMLKAPLPWAKRANLTGHHPWEDPDDLGLAMYVERVLGFSSERPLRAAWSEVAEANVINPVERYLLSLEWDGVPRLDTLYVDYFGAEDCSYIRAIARKAFTAAVARAMRERVKFDYMTVVCSRKQGIGKSTLFRRLGQEWFSDSIKSFEGKEAEELIQGKWIVELAEMQGFDKADINRIKNFLSKEDDQYRAAYGKHVKSQPRRAVFFGTTNNHEYLRDSTGNRRFWPVDARPQHATKSAFDLERDEVDQIWAEAVMRWRLGETLFLSPEMEEEAERRREGHTVTDPLAGLIEEFINKQVPENWLKWDRERRQMFLGGGMQYSGNLVQRDRVCAAEIWRECLREKRVMTKTDATRINDILESLPGWERAAPFRAGADYGTQRGFTRKI